MLSRCYMQMNSFAFMVGKRNFATKIMGGNTNNKKDSAGRRLGIKKWGHNAEIFRNDILLRQRGTKWNPGINTHMGLDHTIHASVEVSQVTN